ncbi:hypothetical protein [Sorangium sp. So ce1097]|uniref:hypothetical protein n=1 Tax=Sorangium sp. So ce1097 TaxID=3133330 RepID=UPI003F62448B
MNKHRVPAVVALAVALLGSFGGCWTNGMISIHTCDEWCFGLEICDNPCTVCSGSCVPFPPPGFDAPILLWMGGASDAASVPECPAEAPNRVFDGYAGFDRTHDCPSCRCGEPSCKLPSALLASAGVGCDEQDATSIGAPAGWDGACAAPDAAIAGELGSLVVTAPTVTSCEPIERTGEPRGRPPWSKRARGCAGSLDPQACGDVDRTCVASPAQPTAFTTCARYLRRGVPECPAEYPDLRTLFEDFDDTRGCTPCACGPVEGSTCSALVSAYQDSRCDQLLGAVSVTLGAPKCVTGPGLRLASMSAQWIENDPGKCSPSGGAAIGGVVPKEQVFFCCQSAEVVAVP